MIRTFRYVTYPRVNDYLLLGWMIVWPQWRVLYHDRFGVTMEWICACELVEPR